MKYLMYGFIEFYSYTLCNFHILFNYNIEKLVHEKNRFSDSKTGAILFFRTHNN